MAEASTTATAGARAGTVAGARAVAKALAPSKTIELADKAHTWPYLVRLEFLAGLIVMIILTVWSIALDAPLEEIAQPNRPPNPSKAPWYFLGLQDMLVYFDPWLAGVVLPSLIIVGLMVIPYVDVNPMGNGYYTFKYRKFAISTFIFGFFFLWIVLIVMGTFLRGPGWNLFAPWDYWDPHKVVPLTSRDLSEFLFGIPASSAGGVILGLATIGAWFSLAPAFYIWKRNTPTMKKLGFVRYAIVAGLWLTMMALPAKMVLRIGFNIKYVLVTPWFNI